MCRISQIVWFLVVSMILGSGQAFAQTPDELRRENEELRQRVRELEQKIHDLQNPGAPDAGQAPANGGATQPNGAEPAESEFESPGAFFLAMRDRWSADAVDQLPGEPSSRERAGYTRFVERWIGGINREMKRRIQWPVRLQTAEQSGRGYVLRVVPVDPESGRDLGEAFPVSLTRQQAARLETWKRRGATGLLELKGVFIPRMQYNPDREGPGIFDSPRYLAPFVEFTYAVDVDSLSPLKAKNEEHPSETSPNSR